MPDVIELYFDRPEKWRKWLSKNHAKYRAIWLVFYKKHTEVPTLDYGRAVEEALCYGWIDSLVKRLDEDRFARKFTPRTDPKKWSESNLARMKRLIDEGRMTQAGLAKMPSDVEPAVPVRRRTLRLPAWMARELEKNAKARREFGRLAPSHRRNYIHWVTSAKQKSTRQRRLAEMIRRVAEGEKPGLM